MKLEILMIPDEGGEMVEIGLMVTFIPMGWGSLQSPTWLGCDSPRYNCTNLSSRIDLDLNHYNIAGYLPEELGLLADLAVFHINSNRFCGFIPKKFRNLKILFELYISNNNRFAGKFLYVVLNLPKLIYLDIRYNEFDGNVTSELFGKPFDAIFINHNHFAFELPDNFGNSISCVGYCACE